MQRVSQYVASAGQDLLLLTFLKGSLCGKAGTLGAQQGAQKAETSQDHTASAASSRRLWAATRK